MPPSVQSALLDQLALGQPVDAMTGATPVDVVTAAGSSGDLQQVMTYADGSINVISLEQADHPASGEISSMGIEGCHQSNYSFTNCSVNGWFTGVALAFFADYTLNGVHQARIVSRSAPTVSCWAPLSCTTPTFEDIRFTQSGDKAAQVNIVTTWSGLGTGTTRLALFVKDYSAWTN